MQEDSSKSCTSHSTTSDCNVVASCGAGVWQTPQLAFSCATQVQDAATMTDANTSTENKLLPTHRRLWSWGWKSASDSDSANGKTSRRSLEDESDQVAWAGHFPLMRGGVVVFTLSANKSFSIAVGCEADLQGDRSQVPWLGVRVGSQSAELVYVRGGGSLRVLASAYTKGIGWGIGKRSTFWLSFDPDNRTLKYGKGSRMQDRTFLTYSFAGKGHEELTSFDQQNVDRLFSPLAKLVQLHNYSGPQIVEHTTFEAPLMEQHLQRAASVVFDPLPLVTDPSPRLLEASQMTLSDFDSRDYTFPTHLPQAAQALSQQILQPMMTLEASSESYGLSLADAIQYSLSTPGACLHSLLQEKTGSLPSGVPKERVQISVALAPPSGSAPGPPATLEILPAGHCSAPHDNANTFGVLRVLRGLLDVALYDCELGEADEYAPLDEVEMDLNDAMWFSPSWYQTHSVSNVGSGFACYLLARRYAEDDTVRWPYVRSKGHDGKVRSDRVEADCSFRELQTMVISEWAQATERKPELLQPKATLSELEKAASLRTEAWVERTDSAQGYTASAAGGGDAVDHAGCAKSRRYSCGPWSCKPRAAAPRCEPRFMLQLQAAIPEDTQENLGMIWP